MDILDFIFTNISLQVYTVVATVIFTILYYLIVIFLIKFYSSDEENENYKRNNGIHIIVKIFVLLFSFIAAMVTQGVIAELYFFRDYECSLRSYSCIS